MDHPTKLLESIILALIIVTLIYKMNEAKIKEFIEWLPSKIKEFEGQSPEEVANTLNSLYETEEGRQTIETLMNTFLDEKESPKLELGGKISYIASLYKKGGSMKSKKCSCGCDMKKVLGKGWVVEKCACGCETKKIVKAKDGTRTQDASRGQSLNLFELIFKRPIFRNEADGASTSEWKRPWGTIVQQINRITPNGNSVSTRREILGTDTTYYNPAYYANPELNKPITKSSEDFDFYNKAFSKYFPVGKNNFKK